MEAPHPPLSSRAQPTDLQFYGPFLEMFFEEREVPFVGSLAGPKAFVNLARFLLQ
jgi:hypothetical protein